MEHFSGWIGEPESPAPTATFLLAHRSDPSAGRTLEQVFSGAGVRGRELRDLQPVRQDGDEIAANLVARGYQPGHAFDLAQRLADVTAELESEREKIERGERRRASVALLQERGQISAWDASQRLDGDFGDAHRVEQLEQRAGSLRSQLVDVQQVIAGPQQVQADGVEAASQRVQGVLREIAQEDQAARRARARMAEDRAAFRSARRPFGDGGGEGESQRSELAAVSFR